jgi:lycopene beta-cyclase
LQPYHYNMVKGLDFTNWDLICWTNITFINQKAWSKNQNKWHKRFQISCPNYSIVPQTKAENQTKYPVLQQHFIGWFIKVSKLFSIWTSHVYGFFGEQKEIPFYVRVAHSKPKLTGIHFVFAPFKKKEEYETKLTIHRKIGITTMKSSKRTRQHPDVLSFGKKILKNVINIGLAVGPRVRVTLQKFR